MYVSWTRMCVAFGTAAVELVLQQWMWHDVYIHTFESNVMG